MSATPSWLWIAVVLVAAVLQTVRNTAQRSLTGAAGSLGATLTRFLYGLPFALIILAVLEAITGASFDARSLTLTYFAWLIFGAFGQAMGTALLLAAMRRGNFVVAVTYAKSEVLFAAVLSIAVLGEVPGMVSFVAMVLAVTGVVVLSGARPARGGGGARAWMIGPAARFGLGSGALFALAAVAYRVAGVEMVRTTAISPWLASAWSVTIAQALQAAAITAWMAARQAEGLRAVFRAWRVSMTAGLAGALSSVAWFCAYILRPASDVRALSMVEVLFSYAISRRLLREATSPRQKFGLLLVVAGAVGVCIGAR